MGKRQEEGDDSHLSDISEPQRSLNSMTGIGILDRMRAERGHQCY